MCGAGYEWDPAKAASNWRLHGVSFLDAIQAFREAYGEERVNLVGMCAGVLLHVTYTERGERPRITSARRAVRYEQDTYFRANTR